MTPTAAMMWKRFQRPFWMTQLSKTKALATEALPQFANGGRL
ncbi:hypothetical protein SF83666_b48910 (plasmid) [Sinorhizobium fredii CCBAU 83666]|nr:hypothetical protein SAMCCGM7_pC0270 [Sinorhizobium americanum CCGM7]ASY71540.1 hypothetical protein SF83666_b48910 [Sinorhizobium fredii CCBAU 83666]